MSETKTISLNASDFSWDDVDTRANTLGFKERSKYIQYLVTKDIVHRRFENVRIAEILMLLGLALIIILIIAMR